MQVLALKLILTPLITGLAAWAGRRYGHTVSGLLIGLPLNAGPIALFLALEHGNHFASISAKGILLGAISLGLFSTVYAALSGKYHWVICVAGGWLAYLAATFLLNQFSFSIFGAFALTIISLAGLLAFFPAYKVENLKIFPPRWDIPLRMIMATLFILALTYVSGDLGPNLSGLLSTFPIFGTIFSTSTHYFYGSDACRRLLKGVILSLFSLSVFFVFISVYIECLGIGYTFLFASLICLILQAGLLSLRRKLRRS
ncbi:MAG TPA: hypothetical protein VGB63_10115 [Pedobacter sp.]